MTADAAPGREVDAHVDLGAPAASPAASAAPAHGDARRAPAARRRGRCATRSVSRSTPQTPSAATIRPQFGSAPYSAQRTSWSSATCRAARSASPSERGTDHLVARDPPRALAVAPRSRARGRGRRRAARRRTPRRRPRSIVTPEAPRREHDHGVGRRLAAVDGDPVERLGRGRAEQRLELVRGDRGIRRDDRDHRPEVGADHAGALRHAAEPHLAAGDRRPCASASFGWRVGRADRDRRRRAPPSATARRRRRGCRPRRGPSAAARRSRRSSRPARRRRRRSARRPARPSASASAAALRAGRDVGVAARDDDRARRGRPPRGARGTGARARRRRGCG